jgi:hypothetical protein
VLCLWISLSHSGLFLNLYGVRCSLSLGSSRCGHNNHVFLGPARALSASGGMYLLSKMPDLANSVLSSSSKAPHLWSPGSVFTDPCEMPYVERAPLSA